MVVLCMPELTARSRVVTIDTKRNLLTSYVVPFQKIFATDRNDSHGYVYQWGISQDIEKLNKIGNCIISYLILKAK